MARCGYLNREMTCANYSIDGKLFYAPRKGLGESATVRYCEATANPRPQDLALMAKGIFSDKQWVRWDESGIVTPFEQTTLYNTFKPLALEALEARRAAQAEEA